MISRREEQAALLTNALNDLSEFPENSERIIEEILSMNVKRMPYVSITKYIYKEYKNNLHDILAMDTVYEFPDHYLYKLKEYIEKQCVENCNSSEKLCKVCENNYTIGLKVYEHLILASSQVEDLFIAHEEQIKDIKEELDTVTKDADRLSKELKKSEGKLRSLNKRSKDITSHYISILGIFSAILLGAFGAMQGFTSLFNNIHKTTIGNLVIISGLSGLVVVSILYILIFSLAKLTGRNLKSNNGSTRMVFQYPLISITFLILLIILTSGMAIELSSNKPITDDSSVFWIMPIILSVILIYVSFRKRR